MIPYGATAATQLTSHSALRLNPVARAVLGLLALAASGPNGFISGEERPGLSCIKEMEVPVYRSLPWLAQETGTVMARIALNTGGKPSDISIESPHKALTGWVTAWLRKSSFLPACGGQTIQLTFTYRLEGERRELPDNRIVIKFPGIFEITAHPPILHQTVD